MHLFRRFILLPCLVLFLSFTAGAQEEFTIGDVKLNIPSPAGFVRIDGKNKEWDGVMAKFVPATNRFLCTYGTEKDLADLQGGKFPDSPQSFQLQTFKQSEKMTVSIKDFEQAKTEIRNLNIGKAMKKEAQNMLNKASSDLQKQTGQKIDLKVGETRQLGIFEETDTSIAFAAVMNLGTGAGGDEAKNITMYMGGCTVVVKGKLLFMYSYADSTQADAEEWVKKSVIDWKNAVLEANPGGTPKGPYDKILKGALIGAGIGLGIALLNKMMSRKNA